MRISIRDIVREAIEKYGADGLAGRFCGCDKDDLFPCEIPHEDDCVLAKTHIVNDDDMIPDEHTFETRFPENDIGDTVYIPMEFDEVKE